jgi:hypothetical protein
MHQAINLPAFGPLEMKIRAEAVSERHPGRTTTVMPGRVRRAADHRWTARFDLHNIGHGLLNRKAARQEALEMPLH